MKPTLSNQTHSSHPVGVWVAEEDEEDYEEEEDDRAQHCEDDSEVRQRWWFGEVLLNWGDSELSSLVIHWGPWENIEAR